MSTSFTVFDTATGRVVFCGTADDTETLANADQSVHTGDQYSGGWLDNGVHHTEPTAPSIYHVFDWATKQWIDPRTADSEWVVVRRKRDQLLLSCDWTQLPDVSLTIKAAWVTYRQALRDLTTQADPFNLTWPAAPV